MVPNGPKVRTKGMLVTGPPEGLMRCAELGIFFLSRLRDLMAKERPPVRMDWGRQTHQSMGSDELCG